jgi:hypothetical protein
MLFPGGCAGALAYLFVAEAPTGTYEFFRIIIIINIINIIIINIIIIIMHVAQCIITESLFMFTLITTIILWFMFISCSSHVHPIVIMIVIISIILIGVMGSNPAKI